MLSSELDYELPDALIAQHPPAERDGGRLLTLTEQGIEHGLVRDLAELVPAGALVVLNDTRVLKARLFGKRVSSTTVEGAKVEFLLLNPLQADAPQGDWQALVRCNRSLVEGALVDVEGTRVVIGRKFDDGSRSISSSKPLVALSEAIGHVPLPPYMKRADTAADEERYQTVFSRHMGSAAAPTAGLHVTKAGLDRLVARGVEVGYVTLHVGAGTFKPVSVSHLDDHPMHTELFCVTKELAERVQAARLCGRPVIAVGTTVVRALESAFASLPEDRAGEYVPSVESCRVGWQHTQLLIQPGYRFRVVDGLLTNFHAPRSTLLALVYAFAGASRVKQAYAEAIAKGYRFLSYGDAMWIPRRSS